MAFFSMYGHDFEVAHTPSNHQAGIFKWCLSSVKRASRNAFVSATAGSGKTTTVEAAIRVIRQNQDRNGWRMGGITYLCFNTSVAGEAKERLKDVAGKVYVRTLHSSGMMMIRTALEGKTPEKFVDGKKYRKILQSILQRAMNSDKLSDDTKASIQEHVKLSTLGKLCDQVRLSLVFPNNGQWRKWYGDLIAHHGLDVHPEVYDWTIKAVRYAVAQGEKSWRESIDYTDMLYIPCRHNLRSFGTSWVFVDEAQDLSRAALAIARKCCYHNDRGEQCGRMLFVGDRNQSLYGFAGADTQAVDNIIRTMQADVLPLSITYRCPASHVALCNELVPEMEAREGAPEGTVEDIVIEDLGARLQPGDLVLCRQNAPLVSACFRLIRQNVQARLKGRDVADMLIDTLHDIVEFAPDMSVFPASAQKWASDKIARLQAIDPDIDDEDPRIQAVYDTRACLVEFWDNEAPTSFAEFKASIESLFADVEEAVWLSTIHRAKGLEADTVAILNPDKIRISHPRMLDWQHEQERCAEFVALSRSKDTLLFVEG